MAGKAFDAVSDERIHAAQRLEALGHELINYGSTRWARPVLVGAKRIRELEEERDNLLSVMSKYEQARAKLAAEVERLRKKNRELNRRATRAEGACMTTIEDCKRQGTSLGRSLANVGGEIWMRRAKEALAERDVLYRFVANLYGEWKNGVEELTPELINFMCDIVKGQDDERKTGI